MTSTVPIQADVRPWMSPSAQMCDGPYARPRPTSLKRSWERRTGCGRRSGPAGGAGARGPHGSRAPGSRTPSRSGWGRHLRGPGADRRKYPRRGEHIHRRPRTPGPGRLPHPRPHLHRPARRRPARRGRPARDPGRRGPRGQRARRGRRQWRRARRPPSSTASDSTWAASRPWPPGCARSPPCPTRWARCSTAGCAPTACASPGSGCPLGVVAIIYENRPNVTSDAAGLCLKSGNVAFLRGSSGAIRSNVAIAAILREAYAKVGLPGRRPGAGGGHQPRGRGRPSCSSATASTA